MMFFDEFCVTRIVACFWREVALSHCRTPSSTRRACEVRVLWWGMGLRTHV